MIKTEIRNEMLRLRRETNVDLLNLESKKIVDLIKKSREFKEANVVAIFYPMMQEVDLLELLKTKKTFAFPKVEGSDIHFYTYDENTEFKRSTFGVLEPQNGDLIDHQIDFMLVPALAISKENYRIGYGKGFYDRFLTNNRPKYVFGVIYHFQEIDEIPYEEHDQKLDGYFKVKS